MSFQDVGKSSRPRRSHQPQHSAQSNSSSGIGSGRSSGSDGLAQVSDGILQYQRNVGILERIARQVGTRADNEELRTQYEVQIDVLNQLGAKLEGQLSAQEKALETLLPRPEAAKRRATHVKLYRDFQKVEATFRTLKLETQEKRARLEEAKRHATSQAAAASMISGGDDAQIAMQLQLQQEQLNEQIMREREQEMRNINQGMHQINDIYKDLAQIVGSQQENIDTIETQMEQSKVNAQQGLQHVQKANERAASSQCVIS